jgi:hypothetical protein
MEMRGRNVWLLCLLLSGVGHSAHAQFDRPWQIFLVPFSHIDVGYTAPVGQVLEDHLRYLDTVVVWMERTRGNLPGEQLRWTIEIPWVVEAYQQHRSAAQVESLMACVRRGEIEIGGMYFGLQTDLCGNEELVRSLMFSQELRNAYTIPVRTAFINDTPGMTWSLAQLMPKAGIPYLSMAMNSFLSDFYKTTTLPNLFHVQAQSGEKLLVWRSIDKTWAYLEGSVTCAVYAPGPAIMQTNLTNFLQTLAGGGYPYNEVMINCATGDNGAPNLTIVNNAKDWNGTFPSARIQISTATAFFDTMVARHGAQIPVYSGDAPNWWTWLFAPSATGGNVFSRNAHLLIPAAETFATFAAWTDPGFIITPSTLRNAYINNLTFEDHNLGANYAGGNEPFWVLKMGWINAAVDTGTSVLNRAIDAIGRSIPTGTTPAIAVFNPLAWERSIPVTLTPSQVASLGVFDIQEESTGEGVAVQLLHDGSLSFVAAYVPPVGYAVYRIVPKTGSFLPARPLAGSTMENASFRVDLDPATGGVLSLIDKGTGREIVSSAGQFNQYRYNATFPPSGMMIRSSDSGSVVQSVTLQGAAPGTSTFATTVALYDAIKRVDMHSLYDKLIPTSTETVDFNFSFGLSSPQLRYEIPFGDVRLFDDELSGFRVKHYALGQWLDVVSGPNEFAAVLAVGNASVTAHPSGTFAGSVRIMVSYNDAASAYRAGVGPLPMDYSLTTTSGHFADSSMRHAYSFSAPAPVRILPAGQDGSPGSGRHSFLGVTPACLLLSTVKQPLIGTGCIVRLFNPLSHTVSAVLKFSATVLSARETSLLEDDGAPLVFRRDSVFATWNPYEVKTLRVQLAEPTSAGQFEQIPSTFSLEQNYPNPFNPRTTIRFSIAHPQFTILKVYDLLGREVAVLLNEQATPGQHSIAFNASRLASGTYVCRLQSGAHIATIKMMLVR